MDKLNRESIAKIRKYRSQKLEKSAKFLLKIHITANVATTTSLITGLLAVYYLFSSFPLFVLFATLHLIADSYDGVLARLSTSTNFGKYYDLGTDSLITILAMIKTGYFLQDYYVYIITALFTLSLLIHISTKTTAPMMFFRSVVLAVLAIGTFPFFLFTTEFLTLGYLIAGATSLFTLARQLQWFLTT